MAPYTTPDRGHVALVTNELQQDFFIQGSPLASACSRRIAGAAVEVVNAFREAGLPIFHGLRFFLPDGSNVENCRRDMVEEGVRVLMPGTSGAELLAEVNPMSARRIDSHVLMDGGIQELGPRECAFYKPRWSAFFNSALDTLLSDSGISTLVVIGADFTGGVRPTLYEAGQRDYRLVVVPEAVGHSGEQALDEMCRLGVHQIALAALGGWLNSAKGAARVA